ncbi:helix-turn-helix domain-containing protein [Nocardioides maradonensis]
MRPELQNIVDEVSRLLAHPVTLEDRTFAMVAFHSHRAEVDDVRQRSILERGSGADVRRWFEGFGITTATGPVLTPAEPAMGVLPRLCLPARWRGVTYGYLWAIDDGDIDDALLPAAMELAEQAGALMAQQARHRSDLGILLQDLLSTDPDTVERAAEEIDARRIVRRGVPVAVVELQVVRRPTADAVPINVWTLPSSVIAWTGPDHTTLLVPVPEGDVRTAEELARTTRELYLDGLPEDHSVDLVAGIGVPTPDLADLRTSWRQARLAARVLTAVPERRPVAAWADLGIYRLLACGPEAVLTEAVVDDAVRRLLELDDPDLRTTALTYLRAGGNVQRAAEQLSVHRQTVYYRLQRIGKVTGLDLTDGEDQLRLHLGLTLAPVLGLVAVQP